MTASDDRRVHALREAKALINTIPLCNNEFSYEAFCSKPKGHAPPCDDDDKILNVLKLIEEALK